MPASELAWLAGALGVLLQFTLPDLPVLLERYLAEFKSVAYQTKYPEFGQMAEEQSPVILAELEAELIRKIVNQDLDRLWLAVPEIIDWNAVEGFRYRENGDELYDDLHFNDFLGRIPRFNEPDSGPPATPAILPITVDGSTGYSAHDWPVFRCVHCEIEKNGDTYVLSGASGSASDEISWPP